MTDQQEAFLHTKTSELVKVWCEYGGRLAEHDLEV